MRASSRNLRLTGGLALTATLLAVAAPVSAEVGVFIDPQVPDLRPRYYTLRIVDDPDPWPTVSSNPSNRVVLNPGGSANGDGKVSLAHNDVSELTIAAWARNSPSGFDVVVSHYADGAWSDPEVVAGSPADEIDPALAVDPSTGAVHLLYGVEGEDPGVFHREAPPDLSSWSEAERASAPGQDACRPSAAFHGGALRVAFEVHPFGSEQTPREIVLARLESGGFVEEVVATTLHVAPVWPEVHSHAGRIWVDWIDSAVDMAWTRMSQAGAWEPLRYEPYATLEERDFLVRGAIRIEAVTEP